MPVLYMRMKTKLPNTNKLVKGLGADERGAIQQEVTEEVYKRMGKYMPRKTGALEERKTSITKPNRIKTVGPYARYVFFGVSPSGKPLHYDRSHNPLAGAHWDRRMVRAEGRSIVAAVKRKIKRSRKNGRTS